MRRVTPIVQKRSAGILVYRRREGSLEVFLVHPGGPFWVKKDRGVWTIPKGEYTDEEQPLAAAIREFREETGFDLGENFVELGTITQASGKVVSAWACAGDVDPEKLTSNSCEIEWPPHSGYSMTIPEVDRGGWFSLDQAKTRILPAQQPFLDRLAKLPAERDRG
jgi:predicted NUDIX family NTP pyrophosphohydrolase